MPGEERDGQRPAPDPADVDGASFAPPALLVLRALRRGAGLPPLVAAALTVFFFDVRECGSPVGLGAGGSVAAHPRVSAAPATYPVKLAGKGKGVAEEPFFPGDFEFTGIGWTDIFNEKGESLERYKFAYPRGSAVRSIRIVPSWRPAPGERRALDRLGGYLAAAFSSTVTVRPPLPMPAERWNGARGQYDADGALSSFVQTPWIHRDGNLNLVVTRSDLYAGKLGYVFGYADYVSHVSVLSTRRLRSGDGGLFLRRLLKIARHEIGHMHGLAHCAYPACVMRGIDSLEELDSHTLSLCPVCAAKLAWRMGDDGRARAAALERFYAGGFIGHASLFR